MSLYGEVETVWGEEAHVNLTILPEEKKCERVLHFLFCLFNSIIQLVHAQNNSCRPNC